MLAAAPGRAQWWNLLPGERLPFASAAASALKRASYGCALPTTNHTEPINATDEQGCTPLILAASRGHLDICRLLLNAGANPLIKNIEGNSALTVAINFGFTEIVALLQEWAVKYQQRNGESQTDFAVPLVVDHTETAGNQEPENIDLSEWTEESVSPAPLESGNFRTLAFTLQNKLSDHVPLSSDADWSDVEIDIPSILGGGGRNKASKYSWSLIKPPGLKIASSGLHPIESALPANKISAFDAQVPTKKTQSLPSERLQPAESSESKLMKSMRLARETSRVHKSEVMSKNSGAIKLSERKNEISMTKPLFAKNKNQPIHVDMQGISETSRLKLEESIRLAKEASRLFGRTKK